MKRPDRRAGRRRLWWRGGTRNAGGRTPPATSSAADSGAATGASATRGESTVDNCQILQTRVNRSKSDKAWVDEAEMRGFSCDIKFTDKELDIIEMAVYGDVIRPGKQCHCRTVAEMLGKMKTKNRMAACELPDKNTS